MTLVSSETSSSRPFPGSRPGIYAADIFLRSRNMNRIEKAFVDTGKMKTPNNHFLVKIGMGVAPIIGLVNRQIKLIHMLNPVKEDDVPLYYDGEP